MDVLVVCLPFAGHVGPLAAVAGELVARGHRVAAYTGVKHRGRFERVGARWVPWTRAQDFDDADLAATFPRVGDGKGLAAQMANMRDILVGTAAGQAADIVAAGKAAPFDLVVADQLAAGAPVGAEALGLPWVTVCVTPLGLSSRYLPPFGTRLAPATGAVGRGRDAVLRALVSVGQRIAFTRPVNRLRAAHGLGPAAVSGTDGLHSPWLVLAQGVPGLEYPRPDRPGHVHFVGRLASPRTPHEPPSWWGELVAAHDRGTPVVHVTQGTLDTDPDDLLRPVMHAVADAVVVVTTGGAPVETLGPLPSHVYAASFIAHDELLPLVDAVVSNGGWGGVLAAVEAGVPLVVAGDTLDKPEVARRVVWSGAGLDMRTGRPKPAALSAAVHRVLDEPSFGARARELSTAMRAAGGVKAAGDLIEELKPAARGGP
jgi:UDP:flavonoid glycosyltransferase YjiC (YdhE family)